MLTSLFGDLDPLKKPSEDGKDPRFAATAIMESVATEVNSRGLIVDRYSHDLVVSGSPAQAIREHFASTRADLDTATSLLTLLDPAGVWAAAVIKALSDAGGQPIERLHLREHGTLRTLATIERTTLVRRHEETLRIYHADVRAPGSENAEIPVALMERSQLSTVIIGPLQPHAIDALLGSLHHAAMLPTWRCPNLLFMLPPNAVWIANKIGAIVWPGRLHVHVLSESMTGASSVWNAMLGMWNQVKSQPGWDAEAAVQPAVESFPLHVREVQAPPPRQMGPVTLPTSGVFEPMRAKLALAEAAPLEGLYGYVIVDIASGVVMAREIRAPLTLDLDLAAAAAAQVLRAHREAAHQFGLPEQLDEIIIGAGARQQVMRCLSRYPELFVIALLDRQRTNLAVARFQLLEIERRLA